MDLEVTDYQVQLGAGPRKMDHDMAKHQTRSLAAFLVLAATTALVLLQSADAQAQDRPLLIVPFDKEQVEDAFFNDFQANLREDADASAEYKVLPAVNQGMKDLLFAVGCAEVDEACLAMIGESFGAEVIMYGSIWNNGRTALFTLNVFDVQLGMSVLDIPIEETYPSDDPAYLQKLLRATAQQIFFPDSGEIAVTATEVGAEIFFDGQPVGTYDGNPMTLTKRPLGEHIVSARFEGREASSTVVLIKGQPTETVVDLTPPEVAGGGANNKLVAYVSFGIGGAAILTGGIFSYLTSDAADRAAELANTGSKPKLSGSEIDEADGLQSDGPTYEAMQYVFYGIGAAAIATGAVFYFLDGGSEAPQQATVVPFFTGDAVGAGATFSF